MIRNFIICIILCEYVFGDALDGILIEQIKEMQEQKEEKREQKSQNKNMKNNKDKNTEEQNTPKPHQETKDNEIPNGVIYPDKTTSNLPKTDDSKNTNNPSIKKYNEESIQNESTQNISDKTTTRDSNSFYWFAGAGFNGYYGAKLNSINVGFFAFSINVGGFYYLNSHNGFKIYAIGSYKILNRNDLFAGGGGVDYFYDFKSMGIFFGVYADVPIKNNVWNSVDIITQAGISLYTLQHVRFEFVIGIPVVNSGNLSRAFTYGAKFQYVFGKI